MSASEPIRVQVSELRRASRVLLDHLEEIVGPSVTIDQDYFWVIDPKERYDAYGEPSTFSLGQLTECLANLRATDESNAVSYALVWLASLLTAAGESTVK